MGWRSDQLSRTGQGIDDFKLYDGCMMSLSAELETSTCNLLLVHSYLLQHVHDENRIHHLVKTSYALSS